MTSRRARVIACFVLAAAGAAGAVAQTPPVPGALTGRRIVISPSHGYYWHSSLGWTTQRPLIDGLIEDIHSNEICIDHLYRYLEGAGAKVITCRDRSYVTTEFIADNDNGAGVYSETGVWNLSASLGFNGLTYRWATAAAVETATARWQKPIATAGLYPVWVWYRHGTNRVTDSTWRITHAGGTSAVRVNQKIDGLRWNYIGSFWFEAGSTAEIRLSNVSAEPGVIVADAVRIGAGMGSIVRNGTTSGQPRWKECSRYFAEYSGAASTIWNPCSTGEDNCDDVTCRPFFAEWWGADAYVSLHTNAGGGTGTSTYIYNGGATAGSVNLQLQIHNRLINDIRTWWDPAWNDHGIHQANFGEVRELSTMPGVLIELAFHDNLTIDIPYLHDPDFRRISARAIARGIVDHLNPGAAQVPDPPAAVALTNEINGDLRARWTAVPGATGYVVYRSAGGRGFDDGTVVAGAATTSYALPSVSPGDVVYARIAAFNAGGVGPPGEVLAARAAAGADAPILLVSGFDRFDRYVREKDNTRDFVRQHAAAIAAVPDAGYAFDGASNEAVGVLVSLGSYAMTDWILGEESTVDQTFSAAEQAAVMVYLAQGGRLFASGAEIGWDLDNLGSVNDRAFYEVALGCNYVADDANTYTVAAPAPGSLFAGLPAFTFDNGTSGTYNVDYPDVIAAAGAGGQVVLQYATGGGAAVRHQNGAGRVITLGFPFETITSATVRRDLMRAVLLDLCPLALRPEAPVAIGTSRTLALSFAGSAGLPYAVTGSLSTAPGLPLGDGRHVPLTPDPLFAFLATPGNGILDFGSGTLSLLGAAAPVLTVPFDPAISGLVFYLAAASISGSAVNDISNWIRVSVP